MRARGGPSLTRSGLVCALAHGRAWGAQKREERGRVRRFAVFFPFLFHLRGRRSRQFWGGGDDKDPGAKEHSPRKKNVYALEPLLFAKHDSSAFISVSVLSLLLLQLFGLLRTCSVLGFGGRATRTGCRRAFGVRLRPQTAKLSFFAGGWLEKIFVISRQTERGSKTGFDAQCCAGQGLTHTTATCLSTSTGHPCAE